MASVHQLSLNFSDLKLKLTFSFSKNVLLAEDQLQVVYLHSCVLAEYLLTAEFTSLQTISRDLNLDPSDIPLLLVGQCVGVAVQDSVLYKIS